MKNNITKKRDETWTNKTVDPKGCYRRDYTTPVFHRVCPTESGIGVTTFYRPGTFSYHVIRSTRYSTYIRSQKSVHVKRERNLTIKTFGFVEKLEGKYTLVPNERYILTIYRSNSDLCLF